MESITKVRLEIAKSAISAKLSKKTAEEWVEWVLQEEKASDSSKLFSELIEDRFININYEKLTDKDLAEIIEFQGGRKRAWLVHSRAMELVKSLKYDDVVGINQAGYIAKMFGIPRGDRKVINALTKDKVSKDGIFGEYHGHGDPATQINMRSLLSWCSNHGKLVIKHPHIKKLVENALERCELIIGSKINESAI